MRASLFAAVLMMAPCALAQPAGANYDETKVPAHTLPELLKLAGGAPVRDASAWTNQRRPEILEMLRKLVYGRSPGRPERMTFELDSIDRNALGGKAARKQVTVYFSGKKDGPKMHILLYVPAGARKPVPAFVGLNFGGNQSVHSDPGIRLAQVWSREGGAPRIAPEKSRGAGAEAWQLEKILARGYALATVYYCDIEPDFNGGLPHGVRSMYIKPGEKPGPEDWGAIGAWAWGLSRIMDYLETDKDVDAKRVALMGHSRLGKAALWAGAEDQRFALVISNDSGEGGAAISRRMYGETVRDLNTRFPHWFCANYRQFNDRESQMPFDQHMLLSLVAPRPLYVASAEEDRWADPKGEFLSAAAVGPVYRLFGKRGLETDRMPAVHQPVMNDVGHHVRSGGHAVTAYDWEQYLTFADRRLR